MPLLITVEAAATVLLNLLNVPICQTLVKGTPTVQYLKQTIKAEFIACRVREGELPKPVSIS